jgi:hypothetical protein
VRVTPTAVVVKNLTEDDYMKMRLSIGGCEKMVVMSPQHSVSVELDGLKPEVAVRSVELIPMQELGRQARAQPSAPPPAPVTDPKVIQTMRPVCLNSQ